VNCRDNLHQQQLLNKTTKFSVGLLSPWELSSLKKSRCPPPPNKEIIHKQLKGGSTKKNSSSSERDRRRIGEMFHEHNKIFFKKMNKKGKRISFRFMTLFFACVGGKSSKSGNQDLEICKLFPRAIKLLIL
jgi:hypothetical protein